MSHPWIGILGGGQLAEMLALAGYPLGLRFRVLDSSPDASAGHLAPLVVGSFDDRDALEQLVDGVTCITLETENVPPSTLELLEAGDIPVRPGSSSQAVAADRLSEKRWLNEAGIATAPFTPVSDLEDALEALEAMDTPGILKTRTLGYDGKGQAFVRSAEEVEAAWSRLGHRDLIMEGEIDFLRELSLVCVRSATGEIRHYPLVENLHEDAVLRETIAPAEVSPTVTDLARDWGETILEGLDHVGVLAIELFQTEDDGLLVNELAPRVHNSGHWTIEGAECSQFENHLRAILGWPLRSTDPVGRARMVNFLGEVPDTETLMADGDARVHIYRKAPRPGRKLGHVTRVDRSGGRPRGDASASEEGGAPAPTATDPQGG